MSARLDKKVILGIGSVASFRAEQEFAGKRRLTENQAAASKSSLMNRF